MEQQLFLVLQFVLLIFMIINTFISISSSILLYSKYESNKYKLNDDLIECPLNKVEKECHNLTIDDWDLNCKDYGCYSINVNYDNAEPTLCLPSNHPLAVGDYDDTISRPGPKCIGGDETWYNIYNEDFNTCPTRRIQKKCQDLTYSEWYMICETDGCYTSNPDQNDGNPTICLPKQHSLATGSDGIVSRPGPLCTGGDGMWYTTIDENGNNLCPTNRLEVKCQDLTSDEWNTQCETNGCYTSHVNHNDGKPTLCLPNEHSLTTGSDGIISKPGPMCEGGEDSWYSNLNVDGNNICPINRLEIGMNCEDLTYADWNLYCKDDGCYTSYFYDNIDNLTICLPKEHSLAQIGGIVSGKGPKCMAQYQTSSNASSNAFRCPN